ncbi:MAG: hypothetical protein JXA94_06810 [Parachlamydiales bacterium]|nr:hypothetical protein [Parachlamydiales bacterium]
MKTYILVHGAFNTAEIWDEVKKILQSHGHKVFCPTLDNPEISNLENDIKKVSNIIESEDIDNIILVGFSYSGIVVTKVAEKFYKKISELVYIDTAIYQSGKALVDYLDFDEFNLKSYAPFTDKLFFDENIINKLSKTYIYCTESGFKKVSGKSYAFVKANSKKLNWKYYSIHSDHKCMILKPKKLAKILNSL